MTSTETRDRGTTTTFHVPCPVESRRTAVTPAGRGRVWHTTRTYPHLPLSLRPQCLALTSFVTRPPNYDTCLVLPPRLQGSLSVVCGAVCGLVLEYRSSPLPGCRPTRSGRLVPVRDTATRPTLLLSGLDLGTPGDWGQPRRLGVPELLGPVRTGPSLIPVRNF